MRKKLSFLIALAISLSISTAVFADEVSAASLSTTNDISINNDTITLTLDDALNNVEKNNTELKLMKDKINSLNKQYDIDRNYAMTISVNGKDPKVLLSNGYLAAKLLQEVLPSSDAQQINDAENARDERLNVIKFDIQRQYMNVLNSRDQIDNINKTLVNIEEKIAQLQEQIKVGQAAFNELDSLNVSKNQMEVQKDDIQNGIDQSLLKIKQYLNIDLDKTLNLVPSKKTFVKFDDKDIVNRINDGVNKDYVLSSIKSYIDIVKKQNDIYSKYAHNYFSDPGDLLQSMIKQKGLGISYVTNETSSKSQIADLQNKLITANVALPQVLKGNYYSLQSKENAVETQILTEKSAQDSYDKVKKNFEVGNTDKVTMDSAALELDKQKNLTERTVNEYMVSQDEFKYMLQGHASGYKNMSTQSMGLSGTGY